MKTAIIIGINAWYTNKQYRQVTLIDQDMLPIFWFALHRLYLSNLEQLFAYQSENDSTILQQMVNN